jgi:hypothetical protein
VNIATAEVNLNVSAVNSVRSFKLAAYYTVVPATYTARLPPGGLLGCTGICCFKVARNTFGPKGDEVTGVWRRLQNRSIIVSILNTRRIKIVKTAENAVIMEGKIIIIYLIDLKGRSHLTGIGARLSKISEYLE